MQSMREKVRFSKPLRDVRPSCEPYSAGLEQRVQERVRASYEQGRMDGEKALSEQLMQQRRELLELQNGVLQSLRTAVPGVIREAEKTLIQLTLQVAERLVSGLPISVEMVESAVKEALVQVEDSSDLVVMIHPLDLELLNQANSPLTFGEVAGHRIRFVGSAELRRGGCLVETSYGLVDGRRETKMERLRKTMLVP